MPRSGLQSIKCVRTDPGEAEADIKQLCFWFPSRVPEGVRLCSCSPYRVQGMWGRGTLTLSTDGPLPAFFADTREGVPVDHTGAPIVARVGQAAAVPGYKTRTDRTTLLEAPRTVPGAKKQTCWENSPRCQDSHAHCQPHVGQSYLCCTSSLPSLQGTST